MAHPLIEKARAAYEKSKTNIQQFKNQNFLDASLAAAALVTVADGTIDKEEKTKTLNFVRSLEALQVFDLEEVASKFKKQIDAVDPSDDAEDADMAEITAMSKIGKLRGKDEQGRMVVRLAIMIGGADGDFDEDEKKVASKIAKELGIDPTEFDLPA